MTIATGKDLASWEHHIATEFAIKAIGYLHAINAAGGSEGESDLVKAARECLMDSLDALSRYEHQMEKGVRL